MACPLCVSQNENIIKSNSLFRVILVDEIPGFVRIILNRHIAEFSDLNFDEYCEVMKEVYRIEKIIREVLNPDKINIASLGNYVPHLHIHIIPRYKNDAWFPDSIWSEKHRSYEYKTTKEDIEKLLKKVKNENNSNES